MRRSGTPSLQEMVKSSEPILVDRGNVFYPVSSSDHADLGLFLGAEPRDPSRPLAGTGQGLGHVKVRSLGKAKSPALWKLLREAAVLDEEGSP